jgi:hypothetical protein
MENNTQPRDEAQAPKPHPGRLIYYHPDSKGTGSALQIELRLNKADEDRYDCFFLEMARQETAARGEHGRTAATFNWAGKVTVKLDFADVCELLTVLEGRAEQAGGQRNGIYHESGNANTIITFRKGKDHPGYFLDISKKDKSGAQVFKGHIVLSEAEGLGLRHVMQSGLFFMVFHRNLRA